ncbi:manganese efflux pump [Metasolibacillus meyeri]|uniref:Manganese efflux pump n=1 Tax=Metasolibacillus meyeri TaxID=1071052 RepID=A0AAW9NU21_9BACL|nr:manganese efflux pump [Metasolibacillus meyeri]MEC1177698.1 manganese efflux pump [Metasolibacillus meyeri]
MQEVIVGIILALDVVALYILLPSVSQRFLLSIWTAFWHMLFPLLGFKLGSWVSTFMEGWATYISAILLFGIALQLLLSSKHQHVPQQALPILAIMVSIDSFSASVSFGMLNLEKYLFILSAGIGTFLLSYVALIVAKTPIFNSQIFKIIAGILLLVISVVILIQQKL